MTDNPTLASAPDAVDRSRIAAGWPLLAAIAVWAIGLPLLPRLAPATVNGTATATLVGFAILVLMAAGVVLLRMPTDPVTAPFVGLAATVATLLALAPLDRPADATGIASFLLVAPWRYALPPLVVHLALEVGWPQRHSRWSSWIFGWYAIAFGMFVVVGVGLVMDEAALIDAVDHLFRSLIVEPAGAGFALIAALLALTGPASGRATRRALAWTAAAIILGLGPLLLAAALPMLAQPLDGAITPDRLALIALPAMTLAGVLSLPFRDPATRDLLAHRLAAGLLDGTDLSGGLREIVATLHQTFNTRGVAIRVVDPDLVITVGEVSEHALRGPLVPAMEADDDHQELVAPIGRAGSPLGEVRLEGRHAGAFGPTERDWLAAFLLPISSVLRVRRREIAASAANDALGEHLATSVASLTTAAQQLPLALGDAGMAIPPPVDAREVLGQMSDGVTGIARHGEGLAASADDARTRARGASDSVARGLDSLSALGLEVARLARFGEEIASSNDTVSGVAFRTNLVANNAAIEATRAGAAGRTFGVLAEEVRRLADTTAATSAAIGERTAALAGEVGKVGRSLDATRAALAIAIREAEAGEAAAQRLSEAAAELEDTARSLNPVVAEANAVAKRRSARDQHLTATMERFLQERTALAHALTAHRDAMERVASSLAHLARTT